MDRSRLNLLIALVVVIILVIAAGAAYYLGQAPGGPSGGGCSGTAAYTGSVTNDTSVGVPGVVVQLNVASPHTGTNTTVTTGATGAWSATLSGRCAYNARYFWQSATLGPRLASATGLSTASAQTVHVSWQTANLNLLYEYPNDANATVTVTTPQGLSFFVDANATGSIATGFLPRDEAGNAGYNFTVPGFTRNNGTGPSSLWYPNATVYRVADENGNSVVYAVPGTLQTQISSISATEPLNMTAAIAHVQAGGGNPYVQVGGRSTTTIPFNVTNATHELVGTVGTFFGSSLQDYVTVRTNTTLYLGVDLTLSNTQNRNACFVVDAEGPVVHAWYYALGNCP